MYTLIVVDFNSFDATAAYLDHCLQQLGTVGAGHVVLVQNGNDCLAQLTQRYGTGIAVQVPDVDRPVQQFSNGEQTILYCHSGENMGYARGNNLGAQIAIGAFSDPYLIVSNNDLLFPEPLDISAVSCLFNDHPQIGVIGPSVTTPDGLRQSPQAWASPFRRLILDYWRRFVAALLKGEKKARYLIRHCNDVVKDARTGPCAWVSGCFMFLRTEAFVKAGMFDPHTFLYGEEMILSRRMEKSGYQVWYFRELPVIHNHAQTTKKSISIMRGRELDFNAVWYYYRTYTNTSGFLLTVAKWNFAFYKFIFNCFQKIKGNAL